ncbi:MAG: hypothetical protein SVW02_00895 [Candidatus Nanohaloarchaea archaeon]|nr:hypothetical protein [Candidatus Nanohaloarchaea archaeon]
MRTVISTLFSRPREVHAFAAGLALGLYAAVVDPGMWRAVGAAVLVLLGLRQVPERAETFWTQVKNEWAYFLAGTVPGILLHLVL